jgi:hypothetical protein
MLLLQQGHEPPPALLHPAVNEHDFLILSQNIKLDLKMDFNVSPNDVDAALIFQRAAQVNICGHSTRQPLYHGRAVAVVQNVKVVDNNNHFLATFPQQTAVAINLKGCQNNCL